MGHLGDQEDRGGGGGGMVVTQPLEPAARLSWFRILLCHSGEHCRKLMENRIKRYIYFGA